MQRVLRTLGRLFSQNPDVQHFEWLDVQATDHAEQARFVEHLSVINAARLHSGGTADDGAFRYGIPTEIETINSFQGDVPTFLRWFHQRQSLEDEARQTADSSDSSVAPKHTSTKKVFLVHGHDDAVKTEVAEVIRSFGLECVILHEQPNSGRTIIEKFEDHAADVGFAVVLLTPDDHGRPANGVEDGYSLRARQNVILELGFFLAKLERGRVCSLRKGNVEIPSDYHGVLYVPLDDAGTWQSVLKKELKAAGLPVDRAKGAAGDS